MARDCSDSDIEEERHDRFKSERNPTSVPGFRTKVARTLDSYTSRARSPLRPSSIKNSSHRSRYSDDRKKSPFRRDRSTSKKHDKDKKSPSQTDRNTSPEHYSSRHRRKRSHEKHRDSGNIVSDYKESKEREDSGDKRIKEKNHRHHNDPYRKKSKESDSIDDCSKIKKSQDIVCNKDDRLSITSSISSVKSSLSSQSIRSCSEENGPPSDPESLSLPRYYEMSSLVDQENKSNSEKSPKKHKKSREKSQNRESKKRKKEKKHRRKHGKKSNECNHDLNVLGNIESEEKQVDFVDNLAEIKGHLIEEEAPVKDVIKEEYSLATSVQDPIENMNEESDQEEGELSASESEQYFGPALPPKTSAESDSGPKLSSDEDMYGPALPPSLTSAQVNEDGIVIGPLPPGHNSLAQTELDARASLLRYQMDNKIIYNSDTWLEELMYDCSPQEQDDQIAKKREAWMTELPEVRGAQIGLGPRKFRKNAAPDMSDRSSWTDTPQDKARKLVENPEDSADIDSNKLEILERNKEMELLAKKSEKKAKSLLETHQKEQKKKKKKEQKERGEKPVERRPFSREIDLLTNKFDEAQKRSIIKKAQLLDSRFSSGESKFL